jgi:hypothetical protein
VCVCECVCVCVCVCECECECVIPFTQSPDCFHGHHRDNGPHRGAGKDPKAFCSLHGLAASHAHCEDKRDRDRARGHARRVPCNVDEVLADIIGECNGDSILDNQKLDQFHPKQNLGRAKCHACVCIYIVYILFKARGLGLGRSVRLGFRVQQIRRH